MTDHGQATRPFHLAIYLDSDQRGGAEVNLGRVIAALPAQVRITIVGVDDKVVDWVRSHRPDVDGIVLPAIKNRNDVRGMLRHRSMLRRLQPDVLEFSLSTASSCQWAILVSLTVPGIKRIALEHSPMGVWSSTSGLLKRITSPRLDAHFAVGEATARIIEKSSGLAEGSIATIYHGVAGVGHAKVERDELPTVLCVARHDPVKGIDVLLDAFALVRTPSKLVIIGDGTETGVLKARCTDLGLDERVTFQELPWNQPAADHMWAYDLFVLPSRVEGFPVTVAEAMLAGLSVIATDVGSVAEAVTPGETGWIVPPEDPATLAAAIDEALCDPERAKSMGAAAQRIAEERFTIEATIDAYIEMFSRVLS